MERSVFEPKNAPKRFDRFGVNQLQRKFQSDRAMVRTEGVCVDWGGNNPVLQAIGYNKVVDPPASIVFTGIETVAPPAVDACCIGMEVTEGICKTGMQQCAEALPFLIREAGISPVGGRILQIDFLMGYIQITAGNDWLCLIQFC